jgi:hypothetical protein
MKKFLTLTTLILLAATSGTAASIFSLDVNINKNNTVELNSFNITEGEPSDSSFGDYKVRTLDSDSDELYSQNFSASFSVVYDVIPNTTAPETETVNTTRKLLRIPYSYEAESIQILNSGEEIYSLNMPERICTNDDDICPDYCDGKGIDSDCEEKQPNEGFFGKIITFFSKIISGV